MCRESPLNGVFVPAGATTPCSDFVYRRSGTPGSSALLSRGREIWMSIEMIFFSTVWWRVVGWAMNWAED